ncbi:hypothetical protein D3C86_1766300 [compost metagenome]
MASTARGSECRIAVTGGHIEHAFVAEQVAGFGELFADNLQLGADHGIVAAGPRGHLTVFQGSKINGCTHEFRSVAGWNADPAYSAVVGSIMFMTWETLLAGKPPTLACSRMSSASGAMYTQ